MPQFVLIDQSVKGPGGHHFDYARNVLLAAEAAGYEIALATHHSFRRGDLLPESCAIYPYFRHTTYSRFTAFQSIPTDDDTTTGRGQPQFAARGLRRRFLSQLFAGARRLFQSGPDRRIQRFARSCQRLFEQIELQPGSHVFLPTLSELDLAGLAGFLSEHPTSHRAHWHLQFHFNVFQGREPDYAEQRHRLRQLQGRFASTLATVPHHKLYCYTTSEGLAEQYGRLDVAEFLPLAYPINPVFHADLHRQRAPGPRRIITAGAVRAEKGHGEIERLARRLADRGLTAESCQFIVQYKGSRASERADWVEGPAPAEAARTAPPISLAKHPLDLEAYTELIRDADIGLCLYDSGRYYVRRSGVLCEFLSAGIPVIVPAGCWLSQQIAEPNERYLEALAAQLPTVARHDLGPARCPAGTVADELTIEVPSAAREAILVCQFPADFPRGVFLRVDVTEWDTAARKSGHDAVILRPCWGGNLAHAMFHIGESAQRIAIRLSNAYHDAPLNLSAVSVSWHGTPDGGQTRPPLGCVGRIVADADYYDAAIAEMLQNYQHYRDTARAFATDWYAAHAPERTLRQLIDRAEEPKPDSGTHRSAA
ncbi:MAG: hypothetical protein DWQ31_14500 [Planctomycetota bacterium]|nr:MAG: hypothetical protein DWQ31_14500 [Planctomycetota bacterium]REJ94155.1 MAG: hypothetical protein DWQ35_09060 [Planctomycetota bacterium]REK26341.1 MAG: hypothetical protein DWQ42_09650 [Planctomycetota bacterium]REK45892.1 MAG: hypothetical protein DWQ46_08365 [Planctomycetota bacterium]